MPTDELRDHDATSLAGLIRSGELSPDDLLDATLARIDSCDGRFNAIAAGLRDRARRQIAAGLNGPFAGVPFLLKDLGQDYEGAPMTMGAYAMRHHVAARSAYYVERCLRAGLVIAGTTTSPELGLKAITETRLHGATRNPWNPAHTPGGSSGGAAAAVAAGYVPMAGASDGGGSIRIPAAYCGLFGLKPSRGRVTAGPVFGEAWDGAVADHILTRSVRDSAAMLDCLSGPAPGDPFVIAPPARPFLAELGAAPGQLRIAFSLRSPIGGRVAPEIAAATRATAHLLDQLGHIVEEAEPAIDGTMLARCYMGMYYGQVAAALSTLKRRHGCREADFHPDTRAIAAIGRAMSAGAYAELREQWNDFARALGAFHETHDLYLTPTTALGPARIGELDSPAAVQALSRLISRAWAGGLLIRSGVVDDLAFRNLERTPFTQLANLTFVPAMSVPLHQGPDGMPIGMQFIARSGDEATLFRLAAQLEQAAPWAGRRPPSI